MSDSRDQLYMSSSGLIKKPTLEQIARHGNTFHEPMAGGADEDYYLNQSLGGAAVGLLAAASKVKHSRRAFLEVLGLAAAGAGLSSCATAFGMRPTVGYESEHFIYNLPDDLSKAAVDYIKEEHELGLKKLEDRLRVEQDYGRKLGRKITIGVIPSGASFSNLDKRTIGFNMVALANS